MLSACLSVGRWVGPPPSPRGLTVGRLLEVDVGVAQRAAGGHVAAHADGQDGAGGRELLVEHGLSHVRVQVARVERGERVTRAAGVHGGRAAPRSAPRCAHPGSGGARGGRVLPTPVRPRPLPPPPPRAPIAGALGPRPAPGTPQPSRSPRWGASLPPRREAGRALTGPRVGLRGRGGELRAGASGAERAGIPR